MKKKSFLEKILIFLSIKRKKTDKDKYNNIKLKNVNSFLSYSKISTPLHSKTNITTTKLLKVLQRAKSSSLLFDYEKWSISLEDYMKYLEEDN
tara:strand:+ start:320 stop:598 length:279 start_codon:yes stop_codon:yes gene_type:complete